MGSVIRSIAEVECDAIVAERTGVLALAEAHAGQVDGKIAAGRLGETDAGAVKACIRAFADSVAQGLHRDGADPVGVRAAMRAVVQRG